MEVHGMPCNHVFLFFFVTVFTSYCILNHIGHLVAFFFFLALAATSSCLRRCRLVLDRSIQKTQKMYQH